MCTLVFFAHLPHLGPSRGDFKASRRNCIPFHVDTTGVMTFLVDVDSFNGVEGEGGVVGGQKDVHSDTRDWRLLVSLNSHHQLLYSTR